jgi:two-component system, OmpR family, sensor histidine kinase BaeS
VSARRLRFGLRGRLVIAFVGVAILAAVLATVYSNMDVNSHVRAAAEARLARTAMHFGVAAGVVYAASGGWTSEARTTMHHLAEADGLAVTIRDASGQAVVTVPPSATPEKGAVAAAAVTAKGASVGEVSVSQEDGKLLSPVEIALAQQLDRTHLVAGLVSAAVALVVALYLAWSLSTPLRRIRVGAERMRAGELDTRVKEGGGDEMRGVARALNSLAETLQREEALRKEGVADLAHELRTPVMGLLARVEAAQDGVFSDQSENLVAMHDEALRLSRLLDDISSLADAQRPGLMLERGPVDLAVVAARQAAAAADQFAEKGIGLVTELQPVVVDGDVGRLQQIIVNLLSNALRYTDAGGRVVVRVRRDGTAAVLEVEDTGIGIAEGDQEHVFERFWRGEKSRSRSTGGAGIGLAVVKGLAEAHGGDVRVTSELGRGSTFCVWLPLAS